MSLKDQFTADEWKQLVAAPPMVGLAVASASPSGPFGVVKEMFSVGMAMADALQKGSGNALVDALVDDVKARATRPEKPDGVTSAEAAQRIALERLAAVRAIVEAKAPAEAAGFAAWLAAIGQRVAEASNEGGFFGFGGERVSAEEKAMLARLAETLGTAGQAVA